MFEALLIFGFLCLIVFLVWRVFLTIEKPLDLSLPHLPGIDMMPPPPIPVFPPQLRPITLPEIKQPESDYKKYRVNFDGEERDIYFFLMDKNINFGWGGKQKTRLSGRFKDEATLDGDFFIYVHFDSEGCRGCCVSDFETKEDSFIQRFVLQKKEGEGTKIILDVLEQIRKQTEDFTI